MPEAGSRREKNFWLARMVVCSTSGGRSRKRGSMRPRRVTGHSVRPAFSARRPGSSTSSRPAAKASWAGVVGDAVGAGLRVEDDVGAAELRLVVLEGGDGEGVGGVEAVAAGRLPAAMPSIVEGDDLGAGLAGEDAEDRVQRADPAQGAVAPAHRLRPGEGADGGLDGLGDDLGGGAAGAVDDGDEDVALLVGAGLERVAGEAGGAEEALDRLGGRVGARALALLAEPRGAVGEAGEGEGQAAGRGEGGGVGVGEAALDEAVGDEAAQVLGRLPLHPGGDLLGEELEQEVGHRGAFGGARMANRKRRGRSRGNAGQAAGVRVTPVRRAGPRMGRRRHCHAQVSSGRSARARKPRWSSSCRGALARVSRGGDRGSSRACPRAGRRSRFVEDTSALSSGTPAADRPGVSRRRRRASGARRR